MRMLLVPVPGRTDDRLNIVILRLPAKHRLGLFAGRDELRRVACTSCRHLALDGLPDDLFRRVDDLLHGKSNAVAEVEHVVLAAVHQVFRRQDVRRGQIGDVDVIADAGAVSCRIIVPKNGHMIALTVRDLKHDGDEVCLRVVGFADLAGHMRAAGVEIAQRNEMNPVRDGCPVEHPLHRQLRVAVRSFSSIPRWHCRTFLPRRSCRRIDCSVLAASLLPHHNQPAPAQAPLAAPDTFFQHQGSAKQAAPLKSCFRP